MHRQQANGFTLVELMVVIAVVAILAVVAMPSYRELMDNYRVRKAGEDIVSLISNARSGAVKLHRQVGVNVYKGKNWCAGAIGAEVRVDGLLAEGAKVGDCTCDASSQCLVGGEQLFIDEDKHPRVEITSDDLTMLFNGVTGAIEELGDGETREVVLLSPLTKFTATVSVTPLGQANLTIAEN